MRVAAFARLAHERGDDVYANDVLFVSADAPEMSTFALPKPILPLASKSFPLQMSSSVGNEQLAKRRRANVG
jgi:hypothetical protein